MNIKRIAIYAALGLFAAYGIGAQDGCSQSADIVSKNLSLDADNFKINRKVTFYDGINGKVMLVIEGLCSKGNNDTDRMATITCQTGPTTYKKDFLGLSDNVTYMIEQVDATTSDPYHYKVIWRPETIIPDLKIDGINN